MREDSGMVKYLIPLVPNSKQSEKFHMLNVTVPFREKKEVVPLIEAGADELYCGYISSEWEEAFTDIEFERKGSGSNFTDLQELKEAVDLAHGKNVPVFLTLNGLYVNQQYPLLLDVIETLEEVDLDGYILADIGLLLTLRKKGFEKQIHISTGGTVFNSEAVGFYKDLGASRVILDRHTTLRSIKTLSRENPNMDLEVFILDTLCVYIDGLCTFMHFPNARTAEEISNKSGTEEGKFFIITAYEPKPQSDACCLDYSVEVFDGALEKKIRTNEIKPTFFKRLVDGKECGACALYDIVRANVKSIKIVGRQYTPEVRLQSTKFIRSCLNILENDKSISGQDFAHEVQGLYQKTFAYKGNCKGNNCYHPSVLSRVHDPH